MAKDTTVKTNTLLLNSNNKGYSYEIKALEGKRLIYEAKDIFESISPDFVNYGLNKTGIATPNMLTKTDEVANITFINTFSALSGHWDRKWLSQNQIIEYCEALPGWLRQKGFVFMFLAKKDESEPIEKNLFVVIVHVHLNGLDVSIRLLDYDNVGYGVSRRFVVYPEPVSLAK